MNSNQPIKFRKMLSQGFSLIELMMVVVIMGILATIAIPNYLHYAKRAKFTEIIKATEPYKLAVELCFQAQGKITECNAGSHGIPPGVGTKKEQNKPYGRVASVSIAKGIITATATADLAAKTFILKPNTTGDDAQLSWTISGSCKDNGLC